MARRHATIEALASDQNRSRIDEVFYRTTRKSSCCRGVQRLSYHVHDGAEGTESLLNYLLSAGFEGTYFCDTSFIDGRIDDVIWKALRNRSHPDDQ